MEQAIEDIGRIVFIGAGATATMDLWLLFLKRRNVPTLNFAFIGRWVGHWKRGTWRHPAIAKAAPIRGELALGWLLHYAIGVGFAGLFAGICGAGWTANPSLLPALSFGLGTVAVPLLIVQPAMGAGIASSRTATPLRNCARSVANHAVFGCGLYLAAAVIASIAP